MSTPDINMYKHLLISSKYKILNNSINYSDERREVFHCRIENEKENETFELSLKYYIVDLFVHNG
jgi:hypothetical protein